MKKLLLILLMFLVISSLSYAAEDAPSGWAEESIESLQEKDVLRSEAFSKYGVSISRVDFIYLAVRCYETIKGNEITIDPSISFTDTEDIYALKGATVGITSGIGDGKFGPDVLLNREQLAVLLINTLKLLDLELEEDTNYVFEDERGFSPWSKEAIYLAKSNGLINGVGHDQYDCKGLATNEMTLVIVNKILSNYSSEDFDPMTYKRKSPVYTSEEILKYNQVKVSIFEDYFEDIDHSDIEKFLGYNDQSKITDITYDLVKDINNQQDFTTLMEIYQNMIDYHNNPTPSSNKGEMYMAYPNERYTEEKILYGCTTYALVYSNMARAKGFPTVLVEGINIDWINRITNDLGGGMSGHFFVEVYLDGTWYLIDTTSGRLYFNYDMRKKELPGDNVLLAKGMDKWAFGKSASGEEMPTHDEYKIMLLKENITDFEPTSYDYMDLNSGQYFKGESTEKVSFISNGISIFGDKDVASTFKSTFGDYYGTYHLKTYDEITEDDDALKAIYLVFLIESLDSIPEFLLEAYPELQVVEEGVVYMTKTGRRVAFIKADDTVSMTNLISNLPQDFFTTDEYRSRELTTKADAYNALVESVDGVDMTLVDELSGLKTYAFDSGRDSDTFWDMVNLSDLQRGFIYNYLKDNYETYKTETDALILSALIPYDQLPSVIQEGIEKSVYEENDKQYRKVILEDGTLIYILY